MVSWRRAAIGACGILLVSLAAGSSLASATKHRSMVQTRVWARLHRPLHIPRLLHGRPCPVARVGSATNLVREVGLTGTTWGVGPAYPLGAFRPTLFFHKAAGSQNALAGSKWGWTKAVWLVTSSYRGPVLIRGRRLDGRESLRFNPVRTPSSEFRIYPAKGRLRSGARKVTSFPRLRAPGCYAYQIDGATFSKVVVFEAKILDSGPRDLPAVIAALQRQGLPMEEKETDFWFLVGVVVHQYGNPSGAIMIYEFSDSMSAANASTHISHDGYTFSWGHGRAVHIDWSVPPHWYRTRNLLELYLGRDAETLARLSRVLGRQFAGT